MKSSDETKVDTWKQCDERIREIEAEHSKSVTGVWFRGIPNAAWPLTTTLERRRKEPFFVNEYLELMQTMLPEVETFTGERWDKQYLKWEKYKNNFKSYFHTPDVFGYMAHLRHHGFPSPVLDWTRSPYVAAYFAFARVEAEVQDVAIFAYSEMPKNMKLTASNRPRIFSHGGFGVRTHPRHFRQQSCYTTCIERVEPDSPGLQLDCIWRYARHQEVFRLQNEEQDRLYKIEIPSTECRKVLTLLDRFNLNDFTLFGSEESLMESLASRYIDKNVRFHD